MRKNLGHLKARHQKAGERRGEGGEGKSLLAYQAGASRSKIRSAGKWQCSLCFPLYMCCFVFLVEEKLIGTMTCITWLFYPVCSEILGASFRAASEAPSRSAAEHGGNMEATQTNTQINVVCAVTSVL